MELLGLTESLLSVLRSDCHQGTLYCEGQSQGVGFGRNGRGGGGEALESVFKARKPKALVSRKWTRDVTFDKRFSYDGLELGPD